MLGLFRRKRKGLKWTLWIVILALSGGMVLFFVRTPSGVSAGIGIGNIAEVAGNPITVIQYRRHYNRLLEFYRQVYKLDERDPSLLRQLGLDQQALDQLINNHVVWYEAQNMGIEVAPEEIVEHISSISTFQENGEFIGAERYKQLLRANNLAPAEYEDRVRREIAQDKLRKVLTDAIRATPEEARQEFLNRNQEVQIRYVVMDPRKMAPKKVDEDELRVYFEEHKENYRTSEQRKVKYISVPLKPQDVELTQEQIQNRMASISEKQRVRASHILIRLDDQKTEAEARGKAEEILKQLRAGADFGELAKKFSEDEVSALNAGDLGFFGRGQMVPEFERVAFSLEPGKIGDLVKTNYGFHIVKVTDVQKVDPRSLAESALRQEEAGKMARNLATKIAYEARKDSSLETVARRYNLESKETPFFGLGDVIADLRVRSDFNQQVFTLGRGQMTEPYETAGTYVVAQLVDIKPAEMSDFEAVKDQVAEDFKSSRGEEMSREKAFAFFKAVQDGQGFQKVARMQDSKVTTTDFFKRGASIDDTLGQATEVLNRALRIKKGEISPPVVVSGNYVVFEVAEKSPVDEEKFQQEREQITQGLTEQKRVRFFSAWLKNVIEKLQDEKKIEINRDLLEAIVS
ncbi:peptidylprolyl isomerase [Acidobacteria bacterium AH-259-A15]|nr:peptidylprolyl isomerase [Acidobacteria bacterium AH-259-A15]